MKKEWRLEKWRDANIDILHCQTTDSCPRLSRDKIGFWYTTKDSPISNNYGEEVICPKCKTEVPNYILFQLKLLIS